MVKSNDGMPIGVADVDRDGGDHDEGGEAKIHLSLLADIRLDLKEQMNPLIE